MGAPLYVDTSAVLRATLELGTTPALEARIAAADVLIASRLALVESARVFLRVRQTGRAKEAAIADAERAVDAIWARTDLWELTPAICEAACGVAPAKALRALDALHLATYLAARRHLEGLLLLTTDARLQEAAEGA